MGSHTPVKIRAVVCRAGETASDEIGTDLKSMQALVGGNIEHVRLRGRFEGLHMWVNETGQLDELPLWTTPFYPTPIAGDFFITRVDAEGETTSLTDEDLKLIQKEIS